MKKGQVRSEWADWAVGAKKFRDIPIGTAFRSGPGGPVKIKVAEAIVPRTSYMRINAYPAMIDRQNHWKGKVDCGAEVFVKEVSPDEVPLPQGAD